MRAFLDLHFMKGSRFYLHGGLLWGRGFCAMFAYSNSSDGISCALPQA